MNYPDEILSQITNFGVLGYSIDRIISLIDPAHAAELKTDIEIEGSEIYRAYQKGRNSGQYSLDRQLYDQATKCKNLLANDQIYNRMADEQLADKIRENFGIGL